MARLKHLEDLYVNQFFDFLDQLPFGEVSEKIDGAHAVIGTDQFGTYITRSGKGNHTKYRTLEDFPDDFWTTPFKSALLAINQLDLPNFFEMPCEIMFGPLPNAIEYDGKNRIVFFGKVEPLGQLEVKLNVPNTDGVTKWYEEETHEWYIDHIPTWMPPPFEVDTTDIQVLLNSRSGIREYTNYQVLLGPMNKPDMMTSRKWKAIKEEVKKLKPELIKQLKPMQEKVKLDLLNQLKKPGKFGDEIEGLVVSTKDIDVKLVDKSGFTQKNKDIHATRRNLNGRFINGEYLEKSILGREDHEYACVLLERYFRMYQRNPHPHPEIHKRNLQAFYNTREELHARAGVQN